MAATIKDIAKRTGLGLATISKYLNGGRVLEKNRIAIEKAIEELNFTANEFARSLRTGYSHSVGIVIPELSNIFITNIITKLEDTLRKNGYGVFVCDCRTDMNLEIEAVKFLLSKRVDGLVNMPVCHEGNHLEPVINAEIPVVLIDRMIEKLQNQVDAVLVDNIGGARSAINLLLDHGHKKIGVIVGPMDVFTARQRLEGWKHEMIDNGIEPDYSLVAYSDYTVQGGYKAMMRLFKEHQEMTAVFVSNYEMTLGAIVALKELSIQLPDQLSLIGFDNIELSKVVTPTLTIVTQPMEQIGEQSASLLLDRLTHKNEKKPKTLVLPTYLKKGDSVKKLCFHE